MNSVVSSWIDPDEIHLLFFSFDLDFSSLEFTVSGEIDAFVGASDFGDDFGASVVLKCAVDFGSDVDFNFNFHVFTGSSGFVLYSSLILILPLLWI